ncbi:hypothetical protein GCM10020255_096530 [Rhodococcus baikonurensis]
MPGHDAGSVDGFGNTRSFGQVLAGDNAIHKFGGALERLSAYQPRSVDIDGCGYREGLSAVRISGGVAGNVVPDEAEMDVNFRFAPDRNEAQAEAHVREVFDGLGLDSRSPTPRPAHSRFGEPVCCRLDRGGGWSVPREVRVD